MKLPKKYLTKNPRVMRREIEKHGDKRDDDSSAYGPWDADYKSRKAGKGKKVETKPSKYTKKFKEMYGESNIITDPFEYMNILEEIQKDFIEFLEEMEESEIEEIEQILEGVDELDESKKTSSTVKKALKNKAEKTGFPQGILTQIWKRGYSSWKKGHVPGTTPQQWAMARVNSFVTGGRTTEVGDKKLYQQAKAAKRKKG